MMRSYQMKGVITMKFNELTNFSSEGLQTNYIIAETEKGLAYIWTWKNDIEEITEDMLSKPTASHGAMIDTKEKLIWEVENCVGSFRECEEEWMQEEANEIVEDLLAAINAA